jgi:flavin-binding protein dodecin
MSVDKGEQGQQWFEGRSEESFAAAAKIAVEKAEDELEPPWPELYDVKLQVGAGGVLSDYRVFISPNP